MKILKRIIAVVSIICLLVITIILMLEISNYERGNEGIGILMAAIGGVGFVLLIGFGLVLLLIDIIRREKKPSALVFILWGYSLLTIVITTIAEISSLHNFSTIILIITCVFSIYLIILEINRM